MKTDFDALRAMKDEDIDCSDIPALSKEELDNALWFWEFPTRQSNSEVSYWDGVLTKAHETVEVR